MKTCTKCGVEKEEDQFDLNGRFRRSYCTACRVKEQQSEDAPYMICKGHAPWNKGKKWDSTARQKMSETRKGTVQSPEWVEKRMIKLRAKGKGHGCWNYKEWRRKVFERDEHKCQKCGATERLHPHHVVPWNASEALRFEVDNGITYCSTCHMKTEGFQKGHTPWAKGRKFSDEHRKKLSDSAKKKKFTEEHRRNVSIGLKKYHQNKVNI